MTSLQTELRFDKQLQEWLDETTEQFERLEEPGENIREEWTELSEQAEVFLDWSLEHDWSSQDDEFRTRYSEFLSQAERFSQQLEVLINPLHWFLAPLELIESYVDGGELAPQAARLLQEAYERIYDTMEAPALEDAVRKLMVWTQGHRQMSILEVRDEVQRARVAATSLEEFEGSDPLTILELLTLLHQEEAEHESLLISLEDALAEWEEELSGLLGALGDNAVEFSDDINELFDRCSETLEQLEMDPWSVPPQEFEELCQEWKARAPKLELFAEMAARKLESRAPHLESLERAAQELQSGRLAVSQWSSKVGEHVARWDEVKVELRDSFAGMDEALTHIENISTSLRILASVERPDDPRLDVALDSYFQSIKSLEQNEKETENG